MESYFRSKLADCIETDPFHIVKVNVSPLADNEGSCFLDNLQHGRVMPNLPYMRAIKVENFRGIRSLKIDPLRRLTLFGGLNGTGKSTLLDSMFLFLDATNPASPLRTSVFKQTPVSLQSLHRINEGNRPDSPSLHSFKTSAGDYISQWLWGPQIIDTPTTHAVTARSNTGSETSRTELGYHQTVTRNGSLVASRYFAGGDHDNLLFRTDIPESMTFPNTSYLNRVTIFNPSNLANRYSNVVQAGLKRRFLQIVSTLSWKFDDAEILQIAGNPILHLSLNNVLLPLSFAGDGTATIAAIALSIMSSRGGMVLIDEFDASIHYSKLKDVWKLLHSLCVEYDVQLVAATHSGESVAALFEAIDTNHANDAIYYRLDLVDGKNIATQYVWEEMREATSEAWEVR